MSKHRAGASPRRTAGAHRSTRGHTPIATLRQPSPPKLVVLGAIVMGLATAGAAVTAPGELSDRLELVSGDVAVARPNASVTAGSSASAISTTRSMRREQAVSRNFSRQATPIDDRELDAAVTQREAALAELARLASSQAQVLEANRWVMPMSTYRVTATFGEASYLWSSVHTGIDLAASTGTPISSVGAGVVTFAGYDGAYGNKVVVTHPDGTETWYAHMNTLAVADGAQLAAGSPVGTVGSTGNVTGPHLHFEVRPGGGDPVDPASALTQRGLVL